ncbi:hypothetical protein JTE90_018706 [Oedothorax gibbosus]|uniref:Cytochrome P450 n=1 Tax=Oedothorax gibbosus TaxID=931172 RepID=A0AAV6TZ35_9ARAC|nr:hypothetical protein JTE90_018706 [Oedothorax gibbosus]
MLGMEWNNLATTCLLGLIVLILFYKFSTRNFDYWKKRGIPYVKPIPLLGSVSDFLYKPFQDIESDRYTNLGPIYGYFEGNKPHISVGVPELIREILVKDFSNFHTRRYVISGNEVMDKMVSVMPGDEEWKRIRTIISPTFTTGKIKRMLGIIKDCSRTLINNLRSETEKGKYIDAKRLYGTFTMDVIASSAFSTKIDSHNDPDNEFVKFASKALQQSFNWKILLFMICPPITKLIKFTFFAPEVIDFFQRTTLEIIEERTKTGQTRNDFLQLLMQTAKETEDNQKSEAPEKDDITSNYGMQEDINPQLLKTITSKSLSMTELVSQCVSFFLGGYETTASTLSFASYLLALNPDIQEKLRQEVDETLKDAGGELTYEAVQSMKYLDNVISETLRIYPPLVRLDRTAEADYKLGDTGITVTKGMIVGIPTYALHHDPKIFPEPDKFIPERFIPEERAKRNPYTYLPFGAGPRNCIAMRFALTEVKFCLAEVIANFRIMTCPETKVPLEFGSGEVILQPKGIIVKLESR